MSGSYANFVRTNPQQARNGESLIRMLLLARGADNMVKLEFSQTASNLFNYLHNQILMVDTQGNPLANSFRANLLNEAMNKYIDRAAMEASSTSSTTAGPEADQQAADAALVVAAEKTRQALQLAYKDVSKFDLTIATTLDILKEVQCFIEICSIEGIKKAVPEKLLSYFGPQTTPSTTTPQTPRPPTSSSSPTTATTVGLYSATRWRTVQWLQVIYSLLQLLLNRRYIWRYGKALAKSLFAKGKKGSDHAAALGTSPRRRGLVIPRVGGAREMGDDVPSAENTSSSNESSANNRAGDAESAFTVGDVSTAGESPWDWVIYLLQIFYWLRPMLMAFSFAPSGLRPSLARVIPSLVKKASSTTATSGNASVVSMPTVNTAAWGPWRTWVVLEMLACFLSNVARTRQPPTLNAAAPHSTTASSGTPLAPSAGASSPTVAAGASMPLVVGKTLTVSEEVVGSRVRLLLRSLVRDPFFTVVLRRRIKAIFMESCLSRIPLVGPLLSATIQYMIDLQMLSFLSTIGHEVNI